MGQNALDLVKREIVYFRRPGKENTEQTIQLAKERALDLGIRYIVVASTTGETGLSVARAFVGTGIAVVVMTEHYGFVEEGQSRIKADILPRLTDLGARVVTQSHILSGVERSISRKFGGISHAEVIAETLRRLLGIGTKVCVEVTVMAADTGSIPCGEIEIIAIAGTGGGADSALVIRPAHMNNFFDLEIREIICMPRKKRDYSRDQTQQT